MHEKTITEISEVIQSSNVNFLLGAGISTPFLPLLGNIEQKINAATSDIEKENQYKKYITGVMLPNLDVLNNNAIGKEYLACKSAYENFFKLLSDIILQRKSTILSKQINLFSTNIDLLTEITLENLHIHYNDGFYGKFCPFFSPAHFKRSTHQRSLHFEHSSEIPVFNIIKVHGSITWKLHSKEDKIIFSHSLDHIDSKIIDMTGDEFSKRYKQILIVNPASAKHLESVLNIYYSELLRLYSSELEKENSTLFILGFSMDDRHIREITLRAAKANPTLRVFACCSENSKDQFTEKLEAEKHPNIQVFTPGTKDAKFTMDYFTENILKRIVRIKP